MRLRCIKSRCDSSDVSAGPRACPVGDLLYKCCCAARGPCKRTSCVGCRLVLPARIPRPMPCWIGSVPNDKWFASQQRRPRPPPARNGRNQLGNSRKGDRVRLVSMPVVNSSNAVIGPIPADELSHANGDWRTWTVADQRFDELGRRLRARHISRLHVHVVALRLLAEGALDLFYELQQTHRLAAPYVDDAVRRYGARRIGDYLERASVTGGFQFAQTNDGFDEVINISEVSLHFPVVVDVDLPASEDVLHELEQRHVRPSPRSVDAEEPEYRRRDIPQMRVGMCDRFDRLLGGGVKSERMI